MSLAVMGSESLGEDARVGDSPRTLLVVADLARLPSEVTTRERPEFDRAYRDFSSEFFTLSTTSLLGEVGAS